MKKILATGLLWSLVFISIAQKNGGYKITQRSELGAPEFIELDKGSGITHENLFENLSDEFPLRPEDKFSLLKYERDNLGLTHYRYQQSYNNIPVYGIQYIVHEKNFYASSANGKYVSNLSLNITPEISVDDAISKAIRMFSMATSKAVPELVIEPINGIYQKGDYRLCWKLSIQGINISDAWTIFIDAHTGDLVHKISNISSGDITGTLGTHYYGAQQIQLDYDASSQIYTLSESETRGANNSQIIADFDFHNGTSGTGTAITDNTLSFSSSAVAVGAHWAIEKSYDFFYSRFGRSSFDSNSARILVVSHYGNNYNNAFFSNMDSTMYFGDGDGVNIGITSALDFSAHELYHGYTKNTSGLLSYGESGALNESFSDIMSTGIEYSVLGYQSGLWTMGEKVTLIKQCVRSLSDPKSNSCYNVDANTYGATAANWRDPNDTSSANDNGGVHYNCGVQNYWFYLLSQGGSGTNDNGVSYNVTGIGIDSALAVAYYNNTNYMTPVSNFNDAVVGSLAAANDLFGSVSPKIQSINDAWCAVGLGANCNSSGINETGNYRVNIYPNPASKTVMIASNGQPMIVSLCDLSGRIVLSSDWFGSMNSLDVSNISTGAYIIKIQQGEKQFCSKLIIQ